MAVIMKVLDGDGNPVYLQIAGGSGTNVDPYITSTVVIDGGGSITVDGTVAVSNATFPVTDNGGSLTVDGSVTVTDGGGSITVDGIVTVGDGGGSLTVDDGSGSLTVDGTVTVQDGGGSITVDGTVAVSNSTFPVTDNGGSLTVDAPVGTPVNVRIGDGTNTATIRDLAANDALNVAIVDGSGAHITSFGGGTQYTEGDTDASITGTALLWEDASDTLRAVSVAKPLPVTGTFTSNATGDVAHDSVDSGNPVKMGAVAVSVLETATLVAAGDRTNLVADLDGAIVARTAVPLGDLFSERITDTAGASTAFTNFGAGGAGIYNYITAIVVYNTSSTNGHVDFRDGTGGSIIWTMPAPATGGSVIAFDPPLAQPTANTALAYDASGAINQIIISVNGFQSKL